MGKTLKDLHFLVCFNYKHAETCRTEVLVKPNMLDFSFFSSLGAINFGDINRNEAVFLAYYDAPKNRF